MCVCFRENEKLSQREVVWQQVENLAKTKTDWMKNDGNYMAHNMNINDICSVVF